MKRIVLVFGPPRAGKTFLATALEAEHHFRRVSVDDAYVQFIRAKCPMLYFEAIDRYILPHYHGILQHRDFSVQQFHRDFVAEWHGYLLAEVRTTVLESEDVVVEGYLLEDCRNELEASLHQVARVLQVRVDDRRYTCQGRLLTAGQGAELGLDMIQP